MKRNAARREVLGAIAEFERACLDFSEGMRDLLEPPAPQPASLLPPLPFGPRKPAKRAPSRRVSPSDVVAVRR
jgi:hypothetical protein